MQLLFCFVRLRCVIHQDLPRFIPSWHEMRAHSPRYSGYHDDIEVPSTSLITLLKEVTREVHPIYSRNAACR